MQSLGVGVGFRVFLSLGFGFSMLDVGLLEVHKI